MLNNLIEQEFCFYCKRPGKTHQICEQAITEYSLMMKENCTHLRVLFTLLEGYQCLDCKKPVRPTKNSTVILESTSEDNNNETNDDDLMKCGCCEEIFDFLDLIDVVYDHLCKDCFDAAYG